MSRIVLTAASRIGCVRSNNEDMVLAFDKLLRSDAYKTEYGSVYLGLLLTVIPILIAYFLLSKYIIEGVVSGAVKG